MKSSNKLKMHSPNLVNSNIEKIAAIFPNCITERQDENGDLTKAVDFDLLRQELSQVLVEGEQERYRLDWVGKKEAILTANAPIAKTLRPCKEESVNFDKTENLFIEGDNLEALKLLQENYLGKVKMIYIDPPYNTGNDFIYEDDFTENTNVFFEKSNQVDEEGNRLIANTENNGRFHSDWLSMMYSRLKLARNLLKDDGLLFVSIDDNEIENIKKICCEVYGAGNFEAMVTWRRRHNQPNDKSKMIGRVAEYILVFAKDSQTLKKKGTFYGLPLSEDRIKDYKNPDNDPRGAWTTNPWKAAVGRGGTKYTITTPTGMIFNETWYGNLETFDNYKKEGRVYWTDNGNGFPRIKIYLSDAQNTGQVAINFMPHDKFGSNQEASAELKELFGKEGIFDNPKPIRLLKSLIKLSTSDSDIVMDFFAGSSTSAHAVMQLNIEDGGNRKFIMVQLPEEIDKKTEVFKVGYKTIAEISKERIRRAGKKIVEENSDKEGIEHLDIGFRSLKIDSTNMKEVYYTPDALKQADMLDLASNIKEDRTAEDLLFQVMLDWGLELSLPIESKTIAGKEVFYVAGNSLVACFDDLTFDVVDEVAKDYPLRFVSVEKAIHLDHDKTNIKERFKQLSPDTEVKFL
ncbi:site-specific DNA-methyltransferase [Acinetobacter baumannii]|uniref:site-specific DNA-methyltransferase n=1 Tax=Acinetobacter baumannii TaxID=470 RepID=UPI001360A941|nr:site-specific DNA-methyltransferase [Acinetobacter baumannii]MDC5212173.1 site-specific DNA-methyltransferase [Acinetobacter baumannii]MDC5231638.1 site-specific DNA-methyltransferase [Acinetobacter baumannii]CAA0197866.1 hypothetical protein AB945B12_01245 [Acinetobacter baumannii]